MSANWQNLASNTVDDDMAATDLYGLWGRYLLDRSQKNQVKAVIQGTPVLSHISNFAGNSVTFEAHGMSLTGEEWLSVYGALMECAAQAWAGFVQVRCRDKFDSRVPARG